MVMNFLMVLWFPLETTVKSVRVRYATVDNDYYKSVENHIISNYCSICFPSEWKCGMFNPSLSCPVLSKPCASCWRLLSTVTNLSNLIHTLKLSPSHFNLKTHRHAVQKSKLLNVVCRCEQCEFESTVYVDGQKFSSGRDPCLHCRCSVSTI